MVQAKKNWQKIIPRSITGIIPDEDKGKFFEELAQINYNRTRIISSVILLVLTLLFITDYENYVKGHWLTVPGYKYLFFGHAFFAMGLALNLGFVLLKRLSNRSVTTGDKERFVLIFCFITSLSGALISTADQLIHGQMTVFLLCIFGLAVLNYIRPKITITVFALSYTLLMIGISNAQANVDLLRGHYINATVLVVVAAALSALLYHAKVNDFLNRKTIDRHRKDLEVKNEELEKTNKELQESILALDESQNMIFTLTLALESKDSNTHGHSQRVSEYVMAVANRLNLAESDKTNLWRAAILHDIGKIGIPDVILNKSSALNEEEWEIMKSHPERGEAICSKLKFAREILPIIRHHHERYDGKGYPDGLSGESIPFLARIISVADTFDAITSPRSYRVAGTKEQAVKELQRCAGSQFDPYLVEVFLEVYESVNREEDCLGDRYAGLSKNS